MSGREPAGTKNAHENIKAGIPGTVDTDVPDVNSDIADTIPIVTVTSYAMVGDREKTLQAGCSGYVEKPINPETFIQELQKYL